MDLALRYVDRSLRSMGYPGFETQMLVWLNTRADVARLQHALARLGGEHPLVTARLRETGSADQPHVIWQFQPDAISSLAEVDLADSTTQAVLATAGQLLSTPRDPTEFDPLRFHLLHRPDGRDVFLMQYNHMLMDNNATGLLLRRIDQLTHPQTGKLPYREVKKPIASYLRRYGRDQRRAASQRTIHLQGRVLRGQAAVLGQGARPPQQSVQLQIATRQLDAQQTAELRQHVVQLCGLPAVSMALLACVFRAIDRLRPEQRRGGRNFVAGIGLDLVGVRNADGPLFHNIMSLVPVYAQPDQLDDRDELMRLLSGQMRERLQRGIDLGVLRLASAFSRRPRYFRWVIEHLVRHAYSLWYAFFGSLDTAGDHFAGAEIDKIFYTGPTWSPVGLTLLVNQYHGQLHLQATYDPNLVSPQTVDQFLDTFLADLPAG